MSEVTNRSRAATLVAGAIVLGMWAYLGAVNLLSWELTGEIFIEILAVTPAVVLAALGVSRPFGPLPVLSATRPGAMLLVAGAVVFGLALSIELGLVQVWIIIVVNAVVCGAVSLAWAGISRRAWFPHGILAVPGGLVAGAAAVFLFGMPAPIVAPGLWYPWRWCAQLLDILGFGAQLWLSAFVLLCAGVAALVWNSSLADASS